jgi:endonuclease III related protein
MPVFLCRAGNRLLKYMHFSKPERCMERSITCLERDSSRLTLRISSLAQWKTAENETKIRQYYDALYRAWGAQHWWPAETRWEVIVGAYLTQNTAWTNVERALANLRDKPNLLSVDRIRKIPLTQLERLIRPSGYFRQKAQRLKTFIAFLDLKYGGSLDDLFAQPTNKLREELLALNGVGPETADSILLYAGNHPVFVVDAYTRRILDRHGILPHKTDYEDIRNLFQQALGPTVHDQEQKPPNSEPQLEAGFRGAAHAPSSMSTAKRSALVQVYNEMHGLIVGVGKHHCGKSHPKCDGCPLQPFLPGNNAG